MTNNVTAHNFADLIPGAKPTIWVPEKVTIVGEKKPVEISLEFKRQSREQAAEMTRIISKVQEDVIEMSQHKLNWTLIKNGLYQGLNGLTEHLQSFVMNKLDVTDIEDAKASIDREFIARELAEIESKIDEANRRLEGLIADSLVNWKLKGVGGQDVPFNEDTFGFCLTQLPYFEAFSRGLMQASGKKLNEERVKN